MSAYGINIELKKICFGFQFKNINPLTLLKWVLNLKLIFFSYYVYVYIYIYILYAIVNKSNDLWGASDPSTSSTVGYSLIGYICTSNRYSIAEGILSIFII